MLGIETRAAVLADHAAAEQRAGIAAALDRLTGTGPGQMGAMFKVMALSAPELSGPPGFAP
jgi:NADH dehydrogenase [ubiquinone] 1 alpha subcomplex assembly factor 7